MIIVSGLALLAITGYEATSSSSQASELEQPPPMRAITMDTRLKAANNEFGFNLFNQLNQQDQDKNIFVSPLSIATALAITYNGAAGETAQAMARSLKLEGMSLAEINEASAALLNRLKSTDPKVELAIANSLWARYGSEFKADFLARNRQFFGAEIATLNFGDPQAVVAINRWVNANTKGKIPKIIEHLDAQTVMLLVNVVYFKGQWQIKFDKALTKNEPFHLPAGQQKQVPMMLQSGSYQYLRGERFQAVSLPYGNSGVSLYLFLPDAELSLRDFLQGLSYQKWEQWLPQFRRTPGDIKLPRFKLEYDRDLNESLKVLSMAEVFDPAKADFTAMRAQRDLFIQQIKHKAIVEVNEEGSEAAAATSGIFGVTSVRTQPQRFNFIADHPFFMAICDERTDTVLFMGAAVEPM